MHGEETTRVKVTALRATKTDLSVCTRRSDRSTGAGDWSPARIPELVEVRIRRDERRVSTRLGRRRRRLSHPAQVNGKATRDTTRERFLSATYALSRTEVEALFVAQKFREIVELRYEFLAVGRRLERGQPVGRFDIVKRSIGTIEIVILVLDEHASVGQQTDEIMKDNTGVGIQRGEVVRLGFMAGGRNDNGLIIFLLLRS